MRRNPTVYVLVLNWNHKLVTLDCVESALRSDYPRFRVVVIDNGSTDGSVEFLQRKYGRYVTVLENGANLGYADGFNVGLRYAFRHSDARYCLVMNNDTVIDPRAISELVKLAETDSRIGFATGKVYYFDQPTVLQTVGRKEDSIWWGGEMIGNREEDRGQYDQVSERVFIDDIYTLVSKRVYIDTQGYSSDFFLEAEEYDWQARAKKLGYKIMYTPNAKLWHKDSMTIGRDSALKAYYDARNPLLVILKHKSPQFFKKYLRIYLRRRIFWSSLVYAKSGRLTCALAKWRGFLSCVKWGIKNRRLTVKHFV